MDQSKRDSANYIMPECDIRSRVGTTIDKPLMKLTKMRPNEPWGEISFDFLVDDETFDGINCKHYRNYGHLRQERAAILQ